MAKLTWQDILTMDDGTLNAAIDHHIYGYTWYPFDTKDGFGDTWWACNEAPDALRSIASVPYFHHTATWERTMALAWTQHISVCVTRTPTWLVFAADLRDAPQLAVSTDAEARVAICRLALWHAMQPQTPEETPHG